MPITCPAPMRSFAIPMPTPEDIVAIARGYVGTPFRHQGRIPGIGLDCAGVVVCVAKELGLEGDFQEVPYGRYPHGATLQGICDEHMDRVSLFGLGDVLLMAWEAEPQHLAIASDIGIIHSYAKAKGVVEHVLDPQWRLRIRGAYRFRGVQQEPTPEPPPKRERYGRPGGGGAGWPLGIT